MKHLTLCATILLTLVCSPAWAAEIDATARSEIAHLIAHLGASGCQFNRNGTWHSSARAVDHLNRKYEYLLKRNLVPNAEAFIERAASESSTSAKPYLVKCGDGPAVASADWLRDELTRFRASAESRKQ